MESNKESLSEFLTKLNVLYNNMNSFLTSFSQSLNSTADYVTVNQLDYSGNKTSYQIPAVGAMKGQISAITKNFESLIGVNGNAVGITYSDGTTRYFELTKMSQLVSDLESISNSTLPVPADFRVKNNWFFESFLNPALFVTTDVTQYVATGEIDKFAVKRLIVNATDADTQTYFDQTYKGRNDIDYNSMISDLQTRSIGYNIDDNIVDLPTAINRYRGSFTVLRIYNTAGTNPRYTLDALTYVDILASGNGTMSLNVGDILVTAQDSEYKVTFIDKENNIVELELLFGSQTISQGTGVLKIKPFAYVVPELQISVGFNEREAIFIRPISSVANMTTDKISKGFAVFTNELVITLSDNTAMTLDSYYKTYVSDFGLLMMSFAQEKQIPSYVGITPDAPTLDPISFTVVPTNSHIVNDAASRDIMNKISTKADLESQITELDKTIKDAVANLNKPDSTNDAYKRAQQKIYDDAVTLRGTKTTQLTSLVDSITLGMRNNPNFSEKTNYKVTGMWPIPAGKVTALGTQEVIQFVVSYRKLSKSGNAAEIGQVNIVESNGTSKTGFLTNWIEIPSKIRQKELDTTTSKYVWSVENIQDADVLNINQADISISKGEQVEIRVKSVSEAGWPINPVKSEWSISVIIPFPDSLESSQSSDSLALQMYQDEVRLQFEQDLQAKNLDQHLLGSFITGDKYYAHNTDIIASGFFDTSGGIINLYTLLKSMDSRIKALEQAITADQGVLKVMITDPTGTAREVKNGSTISFFADSYKSQILNQSNTLNHGKIITKAYTVSLQNTSNAVLELTSRIAGGINELMPVIDLHAGTGQTGDADYDTNRIYGNVPISISSLGPQTFGNFKQKPPYQSGQAKSQFLFERYKNYGLSDKLYEYHMGNHSKTNNDPTLHGNFIDVSPLTSSQINIPFLEGHYIPYDPNARPKDYANVSINYDMSSDIWNYTGSAGGYLTEFCLHKDHPAVKTNGVLNTVTGLNSMIDALFPSINGSGVQVQPVIPISHALYMEVADGEISPFDGHPYDGTYININNSQQCQYRQVITTDSTQKRAYHYPIKLGFTADDEYLVGKYTCGAYLFISPAKYETISIDGNHPMLSKRKVSTGTENSINLTVIFQYRCSDKLENIGGYRLPSIYGSKLTNVGYTKKIGIDIYIKDSSAKSGVTHSDVFSFDIEVECKYDNELQGAASVSSATGTYNVVTY